VFAPRHIFVCLLASLLLVGCSASQNPEPIVVGHLAPFSGADKTAGEHARQGIILAVEEVNADSERINGRRVEVHHADDHGSAAAAGDEAVRLITVTRAVALLGGLGTERAEQIGRASQPYGVPLITPSPLSAPLAAETAFSTSPSPSYQGKVLGRFAADELKVKRIAIVVDSRNSVCAAVAAAFAREFGASSERRADPYRYDSDGTLAEVAGRAARGKPDAVLLATSAADFLKLSEALLKAEVKGPVLFGGEESAWPALLAEPGAARGLYALTTFVTDGLTSRGQEFVKRYQDRFKEAPDVRAASAYDGARLLFEAMRRASVIEAKPVRDAIGGVENFESLTGPLTIDKEDHAAHRPVFVVQCQDGQTKLVRRYDTDLR
jgi:branched-chain amino acid transport system substrate-binding protein